LEEVRATQTILQKLAEAEGDTHLTHFEDTVLQPYQEFRVVIAKESIMMNSQIGRNGTMP